jgi:hypothetical protein
MVLRLHVLFELVLRLHVVFELTVLHRHLAFFTVYQYRLSRFVIHRLSSQTAFVRSLTDRRSSDVRVGLHRNCLGRVHLQSHFCKEFHEFYGVVATDLPWYSGG